MKALLVLLAAATLVGCASLYEGEHVNVAGVDFEGMAWRVDCDADTPESLYDRWLEESPNYCDSELEPDESYSMCPEWMRTRFRYEWAKTEFREQCEGRAS